jgi:hypothetical protein
MEAYMSKEKQIEEIWNTITSDCDNHCVGCEFEDCEFCHSHYVAKQLYEAGYRKSEWISVDERLPKELTHVIVCDEDGTVGEAFCYKEGRFEWIDSEEIAFVTHWMPLPEPPKKGGAE